MSPNTIPAGGIREASEPHTTPYDGGEFAVVYEPSNAVSAFSVPIPIGPPDNLLLDIEVAFENDVYFLRALEVDVAVEEEKPQDAFLSLTAAVKGWLEYLEEEQPELVPNLESQRRYTELLRYDPDTWFRRLLID